MTEKEEISEGLFMAISEGGMISFKCNHDDKKKEGSSLCPECRQYIYVIASKIPQLIEENEG